MGGRSGIDWSQGKAGNWPYFDQGWIKKVLYDVIEQKRTQAGRVNQIVREEGSSELTSIVMQMLDNSISGLGALHDRADYGAFKAYNNRNDALASALANKYGIRAMGR